MAAPVVAGIAALLKARYPDTTTFPAPHFLLDQIKETSVDKRCDNIPQWGEVRLKRVDAFCALTNNQVCPIPFPSCSAPGSPLIDLR
jgi:hypothetical protein